MLLTRQSDDLGWIYGAQDAGSDDAGFYPSIPPDHGVDDDAVSGARRRVAVHPRLVSKRGADTEALQLPLAFHPLVKACHRSRDAFRQNHFDGIGPAIKSPMQPLEIALANRRKDKTRKVGERVFRSYAESDSCDFLSTESFNDRFQTVLSARASSRSYANRSERQCDVVACYQEIRRAPVAVAFKQRSNRISAQIHEGLWLRQQNALTCKRNLSDLRIRLIAKATAAGSLKQSVNKHEPEIVPGHFVLPSRIPEPNYQLHGP